MVYVPSTTKHSSVSPTRTKTTDEKYDRDKMKFEQDEMRMALDQAKTAPPTPASNTSYATKTVSPTTAGTRMTQGSPMVGSATYSGGTKSAMNTRTAMSGMDPGRMETSPLQNITGRPPADNAYPTGRMAPDLAAAVGNFDRGMVGEQIIDPTTGVKISNPGFDNVINEPPPFDPEAAANDYIEEMLTGTVPTEEAEALIREMIQDKTEMGLRDARAGMGRAGLASSGAMQAGEADIRRAAGQQASEAILGYQDRARAEERAMREAGLDAYMRGEDLERGRIADAITISLIAEQMGVSPEEVMAAMQGEGGGGYTTPEERVLAAKQANLDAMREGTGGLQGGPSGFGGHVPASTDRQFTDEGSARAQGYTQPVGNPARFTDEAGVEWEERAFKNPDTGYVASVFVRLS